MAIPQAKTLTVEAYLELERRDPETRYEYYEGLIRAMAGGTLNHARIQLNLALKVGAQLQGPCQIYLSDARVRLTPNTYVYPDATVTCDEQDRGQNVEIRSPRVVFEVLSPGTETFDRSIKLNAYRAHSAIEEIVLIHSQYKMVEVYRRAQPFWLYIAARAGEAFELASLGITIVVDELYLNVDLPDVSELIPRRDSYAP